MDNWGLSEVFPCVLVFCAYIRFPDLKDLMICTNSYSTVQDCSKKYIKIQIPSVTKKASSCVNFVINFFIICNKNVSKTRSYLTCATPYMIYIAHYTRCCK